MRCATSGPLRSGMMTSVSSMSMRRPGSLAIATASAAVFILTAVAPNSTFILVFPADVATPPNSNTLAYPGNGVFTSTEVTARLGVGTGNAGKVKVHNFGSHSVDVKIDVTGFYS